MYMQKISFLTPSLSCDAIQYNTYCKLPLAPAFLFCLVVRMLRVFITIHSAFFSIKHNKQAIDKMKHLFISRAKQ